MDQVFIAYCGIGVLVVSAIYLANRRLSLINGPSINDRLIEISLATCPFQGHWAMPLVTGVAYGLVAAWVVLSWPYALYLNIQRWRRYKPPMSDDELKTEMRELAVKIQNAVPMTPEELEAERTVLKKLVAAMKK